MILISGATGNVGGELLRQLHAEGTAVRALTRDPSRARFPAGVDVAEGDFGAPESLAEAFSGAESAFLMMSSNQTAVLREAARAGVRRIVLLSTMAVETRPESLIGRLHLEAERAVTESGLEWTFLRPGQFASNTRAWRAQIAAGDVIRTPFPRVGLPAVHTGDIASVARTALTREGHAGAAYSLTGPEPVTPVEQVAAIGRAIGRELRHEEITAERAAEEMAAHMPPEIVAATLEFVGSPTEAETRAQPTVEKVTGEPARTFAEWARDNADSFR
ncbi:NAD(P)H-binding protein [Streptomyces sp. HNM0575]|uniref:SDR family oxidoreductase n=1 Tax=Streptomyces sp. HNM0575 TaxID=2716338 RepID=UPI00145EA24A|nr:NAD(P)H-binding protein [Streptomyces sp. HNM0575]NLU74349.1 NAD(P)H-binding protein [Streptomyces sp. HNM0575]